MATKKLTKRSTPVAPPSPAAASQATREFKTQVDVPDPTPAQAAARKTAQVCEDAAKRTCLRLREEAGLVVYIPMATGDQPYQVMRAPKAEFQLKYRAQLDYPPARAAKLYVGYAAYLGATEEAITEFEALVTLTSKEKSMVAKKNGEAKAVVTRQEPKAKKPAAMPKPKKPSAAARFRELIMQGKLPDEQIFLTVKKEFNLEDKCRSHVAWYRTWLKRAGQNPPAAI